MDGPRTKKLSPAEALARIMRYCAYQERSHQEVKRKLFDYGLFASQVDEILSQLIAAGFLNEERFAKAFAGGKFRMKKWGKLKIEQELKSKGLTDRCIRSGLREIDAADYRKSLVLVVRKKIKETHEGNLLAKRNKVARFAIGKGYEPELVWETVKDELPD
ncbi:MAG TPA: RecX family transcriptional regulator [Cytophagales bacterium]|nr:RecX family transcriptional regulator [Cytophagales bacterium]